MVMDRLGAKLYELDLAIGFLLRFIEAQSWFENSTIILTSDHGHQLIEKNEEMPLLLYNRVNVPLFVKSPELSKGIDDSFIECSVDLFSSILHLAGIVPPPDVDGKIWPFIGGAKREYAFSESLYLDTYNSVFRDTQGVYHFKCPFDQKTKKISIEDNGAALFYEACEGQEHQKSNSSSLKTVDLPENYMKVLRNKMMIS